MRLSVVLMALAAKISSAELTAQVTNRFSDTFLEARLINAPGTAYLPGTTDDATFLTFEVTAGTGGYSRQTIHYVPSNVSNYTDDGVGLSTKATVFAQDGVGSPIDFSHVALVWSNGNPELLGNAALAPSAGVDGTYTNIPVSSSNDAGIGLVVDLVISNGGTAPSDYALSIVQSGYGYRIGEQAVIDDAVLAGIGAIQPGAGFLAFGIQEVSDQANAGQILAVARTSSEVQLTGGNEAVFYWNLKQFGFYSVV